MLICVLYKRLLSFKTTTKTFLNFLKLFQIVNPWITNAFFVVIPTNLLGRKSDNTSNKALYLNIFRGLTCVTKFSIAALARPHRFSALQYFFFINLIFLNVVFVWKVLV